MSIDDLQAQLRGALDQQLAALKQHHETAIAEARQQAAAEAHRAAELKHLQSRAELEAQMEQVVSAARGETELRLREAHAAERQALEEQYQQQLAERIAAAEAEAERRTRDALTAQWSAREQAIHQQLDRDFQQQLEHVINSTKRSAELHRENERKRAQAELEAERERAQAALDAERAQANASVQAERERLAREFAAERERADAAGAADRERADAAVAERDRLLHERGQLTADYQRVIAERERLAAERDQLAAEREHLSAQQQHLVAEHERLNGEHERLTAELHGMRADADAAAAAQTQLASAQAQLDALRRELQAERERAATALDAERSRAAADRDGERQRTRAEFESELDAVRAEIESELQGVRAELDAERERGRQVAAGAGMDVDQLASAIRELDGSRRLSQALDLVVDHAAALAGRTALFVIDGDRLQAWRANGIADVDIRGVQSSIRGADLLARTIQAAQPVRVSGEVPAPPFARAGAGQPGIGVPIMIGGRAVAVLYADPGGAPLPSGAFEAVELLARHASSVIALRTAMRTLDVLRGVTPGTAGSADDAGDDQSARRFARLLLSEIKLYNEAAVRAGRQQRDLLHRLGSEIDRARRLYEERVPPSVAARHAYFQQELVQTLADGDAALLGNP